MNESRVKSDLAAYLTKRLPGAVIFKHQDRIAGVPDLSVTWGGISVWIEVKLANPRFKSPELQKLQMRRLSANGYAIYVIYDIKNDDTHIVEPSNIDAWPPLPLRHIPCKLNHERVAQFIKLCNVARGERARGRARGACQVTEDAYDPTADEHGDSHCDTHCCCACEEPKEYPTRQGGCKRPILEKICLSR
jgi:hypothetical protein